MLAQIDCLRRRHVRQAQAIGNEDDRRKVEEKAVMSTDPDPFEQGQRAARDNIPAEANPYADGSEQHALWAAGHEQIAGDMEADEQEGG
jgi:hypothetical protein